jgi:hypothetical protein
MIEFELNWKFEKGDPLKTVKLGVLEKHILKSWKKKTKRLSAGLIANQKTNKNFGDKTSADSFASVFKNTPYKSYLIKEFAKQKNIDSYLQFLDNPERNINNIAGIGQQAYVVMAKKERNSLRRIEQKGHTNFAIGTGQTLQEIGAEL